MRKMLFLLVLVPCAAMAQYTDEQMMQIIQAFQGMQQELNEYNAQQIQEWKENGQHEPINPYGIYSYPTPPQNDQLKKYQEQRNKTRDEENRHLFGN